MYSGRETQYLLLVFAVVKRHCIAMKIYEERKPPSLSCAVDLFHDPRHSGLYSAFVWLNIFLEILVTK